MEADRSKKLPGGKVSSKDYIIKKVLNNLDKFSKDNAKNFNLIKSLRRNNFTMDYFIENVDKDERLIKIAYSALVGSGSSSSSGGGSSTAYDPLTATIPKFSVLTTEFNNANLRTTIGGFRTFRNMLINGGQARAVDSPHLSFSDSNNLPLTYITPAISFAQSSIISGSSFYIGIWRIYGTSGYSLNASNADNTTNNTGTQHYVGFPAITNALMNNQSRTGLCGYVIKRDYNSTTMTAYLVSSNNYSKTIEKTLNINNVPDNSYYTLACDNLNYWMGYSSTLNNPVFTWVKLFTINELPLLTNFNDGLRVVTMHDYNANISYSNYAYYMSDFTGVVPWS